MKAFCLAISIFIVILVDHNGHSQPLANRETSGHNLVKRADQPAPTSSPGGIASKYKFGIGYGNPYMGYPGYGYGYGYPGYGYPGYGYPGMGIGYGGGYGGQYGGQYGGYSSNSYGGGIGGGMFGRR